MTDVHTTLTPWIAPYLPNPEMLAAIGEVALRHSHLDHILRMTIKTLTGVTVDEALFESRKTKTWKLRQEIEEQAQNRLGEGEDFERLMALLQRCRELSDKRNQLLHDPWLIHLSEPQIGIQVILDDDLRYAAVPTIQDVQQLANAAEAMFLEINKARLEGWLFAAIQRDTTQR